MRILTGEKKGFGYVFPSGNTWNYQFWVEIDFDLTGVEADQEWLEHGSPDPEQPNLRTVRHANFKTEEEAKAYLAAWTPDLLRLFVSKPVLWWCFSTAVHSRGWMTKSGKAKWRRTYAKKGLVFAALNTRDSDWRHGITRDWIYLLNLWNVHGSHHLAGRWWEPKEAPRGALEHYNEIERVRAILRSQDCPAPIRELYALMSCDEHDFDTERS